ncbi:hypothetical protein HZB93_00760 [Candidatus Falkowbacteria bacterium]|nr:hypothetical protein [Candidatus Falkowbacteria bacterium]
MSKFLALIQNKNKKERADDVRPRSWYRFFINVKTFNILILASICFFGALYLAQINSMAIKGFEIKDLEDKQSALKENIRKVEFQVAEMQSTAKIQERINSLSMVSVAKVDYAKTSGTVAVK